MTEVVFAIPMRYFSLFIPFDSPKSAAVQKRGIIESRKYRGQSILNFKFGRNIGKIVKEEQLQMLKNLKYMKWIEPGIIYS